MTVISFSAAKAKRDEAKPINRFFDAPTSEFSASLNWQTIEADIEPEWAQFLATEPPKP